MGETLAMPVTPTVGGKSSEESEQLVIVPRVKDLATGRFKKIEALDIASGGRDRLIDTLEHASKNERVELLLNMMADPSRAGISLESLCKEAKVGYKEFIQLYRDATLAKALVDSQLAMSKKLSRVAEDVSEKAINHNEHCSCTLNGTQPPEPECGSCKGKGLVAFRSSLPHQQMIFEATGLIKKGGGVNVNVQQNVAVSGEGIFSKFVRATDSAAYGEKTLDAEVISVEEDRSSEN